MIKYSIIIKWWNDIIMKVVMKMHTHEIDIQLTSHMFIMKQFLSNQNTIEALMKIYSK